MGTLTFSILPFTNPSLALFFLSPILAPIRRKTACHRHLHLTSKWQSPLQCRKIQSNKTTMLNRCFILQIEMRIS
uniref:Putative ovule protein n=1 Tax=Solanum chacoense TaxID=4108 RepID=A0A0V0GJ06_SOLCH